MASSSSCLSRARFCLIRRQKDRDGGKDVAHFSVWVADLVSITGRSIRRSSMEVFFYLVVLVAQWPRLAYHRPLVNRARLHTILDPSWSTMTLKLGPIFSQKFPAADIDPQSLDRLDWRTGTRTACTVAWPVVEPRHFSRQPVSGGCLSCQTAGDDIAFLRRQHGICMCHGSGCKPATATVMTGHGNGGARRQPHSTRTNQVLVR